MQEKLRGFTDDIDISLSRCTTNNRLTQSAFSLATPTPGGPNNCTDQEHSTVPDMLLNELFLQPGEQYVELTDKGKGYVLLSNMFLWILDEHGSLSSFVDLSSWNTDKQGLLTVPLNVSTAAGAVLLVYAAHTLEVELSTHILHLDRSSFSMVDSIAFAQKPTNLPTPSLLQYLGMVALPTLPFYSLSRCLGAEKHSAWQFLQSVPTAKGKNSCFLPMISEVNLDTLHLPSQPMSETHFVELYDGHGATLLDGFQMIWLNWKGRVVQINRPVQLFYQC